MIVTDAVNIAIVLIALFVLGTAETFADAASSTLIPSLVAREDLGVANARQQGAVLLQPARRRRRSARSCSRSGWRCRSRPTPPASRSAPCSCRAWSRPTRGPGRAARRTCGGDRRGHPLARRSPADADAGAHDLPLQRHLRGRVVACSSCTPASGSGWTRSGFGLITTAIAVGGIIGTVAVRSPRAALLPGRHHAGRPRDRDRAPTCRSPSRRPRRGAVRRSSSSAPTRSCGARPRRSSASAPCRTP